MAFCWISSGQLKVAQLHALNKMYEFHSSRTFNPDTTLRADPIINAIGTVNRYVKARRQTEKSFCQIAHPILQSTCEAFLDIELTKRAWPHCWHPGSDIPQKKSRHGAAPSLRKPTMQGSRTMVC
jgi:hypothetical protein